jgi:hypothetical protein
MDTPRTHLQAIAAHQHGLFTSRQAHDAGFDAADVERHLRELAWHRIRPDVYVEQAAWRSADAVGRHLLMVRAALLHLEVPAVVSHWSAAAAWGLALHQPNLSRVHLTRTDLESAQLDVGLHQHAAPLRPGEFTISGDLPVTTLARTVIDVAWVGPFDSAVVAADSALRLGLRREELVAALHAGADFAGSGAAGRVVAFADGRSASAGESLTRVVFAELDLPAPDLHAELRSPDGAIVARCDFVFAEQRTIAEFDGRVPYQRRSRPDDDPAAAEWRERRQEELLRNVLGYEVVRVTWSDLHPANRHALGERLLQAFARAERGRLAA